MKEEPRSARFFLTPPHTCSYLPEEQAQTIFLDPRERVGPELYTALTAKGFRRSGAHLYRPQCEQCRACIPTRIPVAEFKPRRAQRRADKRNADLRYELGHAEYRPEVYRLYERYIAVRHRDGDMYPASPDQFKSFLLCPWSSTYYLSAYDGDTLLAVAVLDRLEDGLSAIYTFFEPDCPERSLGTQMVLEEIRMAQALDLPYLYLGYWIEQAEKMRYKAEFRPVELLVNNYWQRHP